MSRETPDESTQATSESDVTKEQAVISARPEMTSALDFRKKRESRSEPKTVKLESTGVVIQYMRRSVQGLILAGVIPKDIATKIINTQVAQQGARVVKIDDLATTHEIQKIVIRESMLSPKVVTDREPDYEAGEIAFTDLDDEEVTEIYNLATGVGNKTVDSFRIK